MTTKQELLDMQCSQMEVAPGAYGPFLRSVHLRKWRFQVLLSELEERSFKCRFFQDGICGEQVLLMEGFLLQSCNVSPTNFVQQQMVMLSWCELLKLILSLNGLTCTLHKTLCGEVEG